MHQIVKIGVLITVLMWDKDDRRREGNEQRRSQRPAAIASQGQPIGSPTKPAARHTPPDILVHLKVCKRGQRDTLVSSEE